MKKRLYFFVGLFFLLSMTACDRNAGTSATLSIKFPEAPVTSLSKSVSALAEGDDEMWSSIAPSGFKGTSPFNCYGVYLAGPDADLKRNRCYRTDGTFEKRLGVWKGGVPAGKTVEFEVSPGENRIVGIFGFHAADGACTDFTGTNKIRKSLLSKPYILGEVGSLNIREGTTTEVNVPLAFKTDGWFEECEGPDFGSGKQPSMGGGDNPLAYYGTGADGDLTINAGSIDPRNQSTVLGVPMITTSRVTAILPGATAVERLRSIQLMSGSLATKFKIDDEVMLYIAAASPAGCGTELSPGFRTRAVVKNIVNDNTLSVLMDDIRFTALTTAQVSADSFGNGRNFCRLVVSRVPHLNNLTFGAGAGIYFNTGSFGDMSVSTGVHDAGIMFIRVRGSVTLNGSAHISLSGNGFKGGFYSGTISWAGQGILGAESASATANGSGGIGYQNSIGPTGGANGGAGGIGFNGVTPSNVVGDSYGCGSAVYDPDMKCLMGKIFLGSGGGASYDSNGGAGGGLLILTAQKLVLNNNILDVQSSGSNAIGGSTQGAAGGSGGSILMNFGSILGQADARLSIQSNGGVSDIGHKGGSGGGGRNHLRVVESCGLQPGQIVMTAYGGPKVGRTNVGGAGGHGTNMINGPVSCLGAYLANSTPLLYLPNGPVTAGTTVSLFGVNLNALTDIQLINSTTNAVVTATMGNRTDSDLDFTVPGATQAGTYYVQGLTATGFKAKLDRVITVSSP